jgi:putative transposase
MKRSTTPTFVATIPLAPTPAQAKRLLKRFQVGRQVYNSLVGHIRKRDAAMKRSPEWKATRTMPKGAERTVAFKALYIRFGVRKFDVGAWASRITPTWINKHGHLSSQLVENLAHRAFQAYEAAEAARIEFFKRKTPGKPPELRFRKRHQLPAIEGRQSGLVWRDRSIVWGGLTIASRIDSSDAVIAHALSRPIKRARVICREIRGKYRYFAQILCEGHPYIKPGRVAGTGIVGIDIGVSTIAVVGQAEAFLDPLCPGLANYSKEIRRLQRKADRQTRASNPDAFDAKGRVKRGVRLLRSNGWHRTKSKIADAQRRLAEHRKNLHGRLVARIIAMGDTVHIESISYFGWQAGLFGRQVGRNAPAMLIARLKAEAAKHGIPVIELSTYATRLSQTCHCGVVKKKPLSQRVHRCECGVVAQRDLYSAWLARFVTDNSLAVDQAQKAWSGDCARLDAAASALTPLERLADKGSRPTRAPKIDSAPTAGREQSLPGKRPRVDLGPEPPDFSGHCNGGKSGPAKEKMAVGCA